MGIEPRLTYTASLVPTEQVVDRWCLAAEHLAKAIECDEGRRTLHDIVCGLVNGQTALWLVSEPDTPRDGGGFYIGMTIGAVVTSIINYPHHRALRLEWLAGERLEEWAHLVAEVEAHAKEYGCQSVEFAGRPGLARTLKHYGYEPMAVEARKLI
jgi:hypothetical protein